jgi:CMP-N,N'-diacetyllegionaminic acid synthase
MKPLVVIPARGGSKGVPGKNIKLLNGKPLIRYTIDAALELFDAKDICVSTDDPQIRDVVEQTGLKVPFLRPAELATDRAGTYEVLLHAIQFYTSNGYYPDTLILLQPTSPFRTVSQIREALTLYTQDIEMVVSVKETASNPYYVLFEEDENGFLAPSKKGNFIRRQDAPKVWEYNGAIYIIRVNSLLQQKLHAFTRVKKYVMDEASSHDIDTMLDWLLAEAIIEKDKGKH